MKNSQNNKRLQLLLIVLIAVAALGIGYASISGVNLIINGMLIRIILKYIL